MVKTTPFVDFSKEPMLSDHSTRVSTLPWLEMIQEESRDRKKMLAVTIIVETQ